MAECLGQVKTTMGHDAVILHTRTLHTRRWLGLRRQELIEITAGTRPPRHPRRAAGAAMSATIPTTPAIQTRQLPATYQRPATQMQAPLPAPASSPMMFRDPIANGRQLLETPAAGAAVMLSLSQEVSSLKTMVKDFFHVVQQQQAPQVPEDLFEYYLQLTQNQVADELATDIVKNLKKSIRPEHLQQPDFIREKLADQLEKMLPTAGPIVRKKAVGPHVVALIGPTGVGKTTTVAKLAANLQLREKHRVGLITIDTYRIAAIDQLRRYAEIIGSPLKVVASADEMRDALRAMQDCDFILVDTAGRSPNDTLKLNELKGLLAVAEPDEVHLVLSTTASQECVELAIEKFADVRVDKIIFTKLDEAAHVGTVLNVMRKVNKSLSYITTGQDVPDDIEVGRGRRLAQMILGQGKTV